MTANVNAEITDINAKQTETVAPNGDSCRKIEKAGEAEMFSYLADGFRTGRVERNFLRVQTDPNFDVRREAGLQQVTERAHEGRDGTARVQLIGLIVKKKFSIVIRTASKFMCRAPPDNFYCNLCMFYFKKINVDESFLALCLCII